MVVTDPVLEIKRLTTRLLQPELTKPDAVHIIKELHAIISFHSQFSGKQNLPENTQDVELHNGYAIMANEAAECLFDTWRTVKFLRGTYRAILDCRKRNPEQQVCILYAGCGPYALFFTLLAPLFKPSELAFTLIEVNGKSFKVAQQLISELGLDDYLEEMLLCDAINYNFPVEKIYHILFSETMDKALRKEALVPILVNLMPQLQPFTVVIPQTVVIEAELFLPFETEDGSKPKWHQLEKTKGEDLGVVFDLKKNLDEGLIDANGFLNNIKVADLDRFGFLVFKTKVTVFEDVVLGHEESDITQMYIRRLSAPQGEQDIVFHYPLNKRLGLRFITS